MNRNSFAKSFKLLIVAMILLLAFFREPKHQWMYIAVFGLWSAYLLFGFLARRIACLGRLFKRAKNSIAEKWSQRPKKQRPPSTEPVQELPEPAPQADKLLLGHINCRITEKLQAVFADATWKWQEAHPEQIARGGTGRIRIEGAAEYTHADVTVDQYFRISFAMMKIVSLQDVLVIADGPEPTADEQQTPAAVNLSDWYEWVGKEVLHDVITELNTHGYSRIFIKETGEIYVVEDGNEAVKATLQEMPRKNRWQELIGVFAAGDLRAEIDNDRLAVAWA